MAAFLQIGGSLFMSVLITTALLLMVSIRTPNFWKLPYTPHVGIKVINYLRLGSLKVKPHRPPSAKSQGKL